MFKRLEISVHHHWRTILFLIIVCLSVFLRTYRLESFPTGFSVDEASIGYNAYGILTNRRDEWLVRAPLSFKAFGEFKPPIAIYAAAVTTALFGSTHFAVRLPMAIAGVVTTIATFWIVRKIMPSLVVSYLAMLLVAISPINIHFSRIAFESSIGVAAIASGVAMFLWGSHNRRFSWFYLGSFISFAAAMYSNHATKIVVPFLIVFLLLHSIKVWSKRPAGIIIGGLLFLLMCLPLLHQTLNGPGAGRFFMVSAITSEQGLKPLPEIGMILFRNYASHLTPSFLLFGETDTYRHGNGKYGILSFFELTGLIAGIWFLSKSKELRRHWWLLAALVVSILPAAIGTTIPHPNRVHHIVPWVQILAAVGIWQLIQCVPQYWRRTTWGVLGVLVSLQLFWQTIAYYQVFGMLAAQDFQYGYQAAVEYAIAHEDSVDEIFITSEYDHPYIYLLFYKRMPPMTYHFGGLIKYKLHDIQWQDLKAKERVLIIAAPNEIPDSVPLTHTIRFPDGSIAFKIIKL